jgi:hypothetical protein
MNHKEELKKLWLWVETHNKYDNKDLRVDIYTHMWYEELRKLIDYTYPWFWELVKVKSKSKHNIYLFTPTGI